LRKELITLVNFDITEPSKKAKFIPRFSLNANSSMVVMSEELLFELHSIFSIGEMNIG